MALVERISVKFEAGDKSTYPVALLEDAFQAEVVAICAHIPKRGVCEWVRSPVPTSSSFKLHINGAEPIKNIIINQTELLEMFQRNEFVAPNHF